MTNHGSISEGLEIPPEELILRPPSKKPPDKVTVLISEVLPPTPKLEVKKVNFHSFMSDISHQMQRRRANLNTRPKDENMFFQKRQILEITNSCARLFRYICYMKGFVKSDFDDKLAKYCFDHLMSPIEAGRTKGNLLKTILKPRLTMPKLEDALAILFELKITDFTVQTVNTRTGEQIAYSTKDILKLFTDDELSTTRVLSSSEEDEACKNIDKMQL